MGSSVIAYGDWWLGHKGKTDLKRYQKKVREAIKNNLAQVISQETIIMADEHKVIKVPVHGLKEYYFRFDPHSSIHIGQGADHYKEGELLGNSVANKGYAIKPSVDGAPEEIYYEAEITVGEIVQLVFEDLSLPGLKWQQRTSLTAPHWEFDGISPQGITGNLHRRRTILAALKRSILAGEENLNKISVGDLRFKTWREKSKPVADAIIVAMMDVSKSMGTYEKYIARGFFLWMTRFLRTQYDRVQIIFITHQVQAEEICEQEFFTHGSGGGTRCSAVYQLAWEIINQRYPVNHYNIYAFHCSDGENIFSDYARSMRYMNKLLSVCRLVGYVEIKSPYEVADTLYGSLKKINHPRLICVDMKDKYDVYPALKAIFSPCYPAELNQGCMVYE